jgi:uncharacterized protein YfdQ (DUF2303 family)
MFDKEAIEAISEGASIQQAIDAVQSALAGDTIAALPEHFKLRDLEPYMAVRRRARGVMSTESVEAFAEYTVAHSSDGARVFVDAQSMSATAVLNLGTKDEPGHADNLAVVTMKKTAAYEALLQHANGRGLSQAAAAEFLEDWQDMIECFKDNEKVTGKKAITAIRKLSIESMRKLESSEQSLAASKSTFESVQATSADPIPTHIYFTCEPYAGLPERLFVMRFGVLTGADKPVPVLRIVKQEQHGEEMALQFAAKVSATIKSGIPVSLGKYTRSN